MIQWIEASGKNETAAIATALATLGLERDDVMVEVLERAKSGFLGIGASPARIKVTYEVPDPVEEAPAPSKTATPVPPVAPSKKPQPAPVEAEPVQAEAPIVTPVADVQPVAEPQPRAEQAPQSEEPKQAEAEQDVGQDIRAFLDGLLSRMGVEAQLRLEQRKEGGYQIYLEGEHLGALIGHRGETLDAIQQLTSYAVNRDRQKRLRIYVDVENYRKKREEALQGLAKKVAMKVLKYRRNITLEPMNAYERHVIHEALQDVPDILTYSTGSEPNRRTVIAYSRGKHNY